VLLTCPTCRSGLAVPDGTSAMVRCPACKAVFAPADGLAPPDPEPEEKPRKKPARRSRDDDDEDDRPRRKRAARDADGDENRDFDPGDPGDDKKHRKKRRRDDEDDGLSPEERAALKSAFARATWGCRLVWLSFGCFILSMFFVDIFWFLGAIPAIGTDPGIIVTAGVVGALGWAMGAVGVGLCLSGPASPGHWGYGITAGVLTVVHLVMVLAVAVQGKEYSGGLVVDPGGPASHWGLVPTRLDAVTYYLTVLAYKDVDFVPKGKLNFSIVVGVVEILRTTLVLMLLSCLALAARDKEASYRCTRAAGYASYGPGFMALGMLAFTVLLVESRAGVSDFTKIIFTTSVMGTYVILAGCMLPGFMASHDVTDACEFPFQSDIPQL
jgi:LSD1 subclass zinc finger protein